MFILAAAPPLRSAAKEQSSSFRQPHTRGGAIKFMITVPPVSH